MKIEYFSPALLIPYSQNNKIHDDEQVERIANSIKEFWFIQPLVVDQENNVIIWHGRLLASKYLWLEEVPVVKLENLSENQIKKLRILDNKLNESNWDIDNLKLELSDLDFDLSIGELNLSAELLFPDLKLFDDEETEIEEDDIPEVSENTIVEYGDLFQLWSHRLICWDSTKIEIINEVLGEDTIDMVFTDPPYNIWYSWVKDKRKIENDKMDESDFLEFLKSGIPFCDTSYVCCSWQYAHLFKQAMTEIWMPPKAMIVWNKVNPAQNLDKYFKQHEIIFYYWKFWGEKTLRGDIREVKRQKNTLHPTMKPLELIAIALKDNPDKKIIYDGFGGSGSTLIACEQLNRKCLMIELDPKYVEVIIKRYHNLKPEWEIKCLNRDIDISQILDSN